MDLEAGALVGALVLAASSFFALVIATFRAGKHWQKVVSQMEITNMAWKVMEGRLNGHDTDIKELYAKWDEIITHYVSKRNCERTHTAESESEQREHDRKG
jgi:uncharacterized protein YhaN